MSIMANLPKYLVIAVTVGSVIVVVSKMTKSNISIAVNVPSLSKEAIQGQQLFDDNCSACHGQSAAGSDKGPPLIHKIYEPNHHGDGAFQMAAKRGARAHHWKFGNMPAQPQVKPSEVAAIVRYVRELQRANGIY
ncbi:MAG: cytochrome c [Rhizobiaceae bacterium]